MGRSKGKKKEAYHQLDRCFDYSTHPGKDWVSVFGNTNPIVLEIGCGKAELSLALAGNNSEINVIGIDVKADRLFAAGGKAQLDNLNNIAFLRSNVIELAELFDPNSVQAIWITFPDPFPRDKQAKHRLVYPLFLDLYRKLLQPGGIIYFKTDNENLFRYTLEVLKLFPSKIISLTTNLHISNLKNDINGVMTTFEKKFHSKGMPIYYLEFQLLAGAYSIPDPEHFVLTAHGI